MKSVILDTIPYGHRFGGASLLVAKANRLAGMLSEKRDTDRKQLIAAVSYYDMALVLSKPYDPNYPTILNWKCNALLRLGLYAEAVDWYREIVRISDETDGKVERNATAKLAEEMIAKYSGHPNEADLDSDGSQEFDDPPFCMFAEEFCQLLTERKFKKAHTLLAPFLKEQFTPTRLKESWTSMVGAERQSGVDIALQTHLLEWPARKPDDIGWCYFSISGTDFSEGIALVVGRTPHHAFWISSIEFGRP